jgi:hypothetical protein
VLPAYQVPTLAKVREAHKAQGVSVPRALTWREESLGSSGWRSLVLPAERLPKGDGPIVADHGCGKPQTFRRCSIASSGITVTVPPLAGQEDTFIGPRRNPIPNIVTKGRRVRWCDTFNGFVPA